MPIIPIAVHHPALLPLVEPTQDDLPHPVRVEEELRGYLKDWSGLGQRHPAQARQILRKLLPNRLRVWREIRDGEKVYRFEGEASVGKLFNGVVHIERFGVPNGI